MVSVEENKPLDWQDAIELITPYVVKISTPDGWGTGFFIWNAKNRNLCGIATAAHVVNHAHYWEQPIRIDHFASGESMLLRHNNRAIFVADDKDTAAIAFSKGNLTLPEEPLTLTPEGKYLKLGNEVGWVGYPVIASGNLCFFSGRASSWLQGETRYLVDGVAINGVSGGPAFFLSGKWFAVIGVVSAYMANRATGETLPGLCVVTDVSHFLQVLSDFNSIDQAKEEETPATPPPLSSESIT